MRTEKLPLPPPCLSKSVLHAKNSCSRKRTDSKSGQRHNLQSWEAPPPPQSCTPPCWGPLMHAHMGWGHTPLQHHSSGCNAMFQPFSAKSLFPPSPSVPHRVQLSIKICFCASNNTTAQPACRSHREQMSQRVHAYVTKGTGHVQTTQGTHAYVTQCACVGYTRSMHRSHTERRSRGS